MEVSQSRLMHSIGNDSPGGNRMCSHSEGVKEEPEKGERTNRKTQDALSKALSRKNLAQTQIFPPPAHAGISGGIGLV